MTVMFLAGGEVETLTRALLDNGVKNILYSYFYIMQMRRERFIERMQQEHPDVRWFLDSGSYTYQAKWNTDRSALPPKAEFVRRYFDYIDEFGAGYCRITEPDLDAAGGGEDTTVAEVTDWREEMLSRWPHLNVMPVWHGLRGREAWTWYCRDARIRCLAFGSNSGSAGKLRQMLMEARMAGKPCHGFGLTQMRILSSVPMDSVDSTSWVMGQKYGTLYVFRDNKFIVLPSDQKSKRRLYSKYLTAIGCDPKKVIADDVGEVRKANVIAWRNLAGRLEAMRHRMGMTLMEPVGAALDPRSARVRDVRPEGAGRPLGYVPKGEEEAPAGAILASPPPRVAYPRERGQE